MLRGAVCCSSCGKQYRAAWTQGEYKKYAYYWCQNTKCKDYSRSIQRDVIEGEFATLLQTIQPTQTLAEAVKVMFKKAWAMQSAKADEHARHYRTELANVEQEINQLLDRIVDASSPRVVQAYEKRIDELENKKLIFAEKAAETAAPKHGIDEMLELSLTFLANPLKIWNTERFELRRLLLKLVFRDKLHYLKNEGYRTPETTSVSALFRQFCEEKIKMVPLARLELARPKSTDFKSAASTNSATGATRCFFCTVTHRLQAKLSRHMRKACFYYSGMTFLLLSKHHSGYGASINY